MPETRLTLIVTPHFNIAATMGFLDPFRAANYLAGRSLFRWALFSEAGGACPASNGTAVMTQPLGMVDSGRSDMLVLSSSWTPEAYASKALLGVVRRAARSGAMLCGIDTGAFLLAQAGVLDGHRATCHYEHIDAFAETYPDVELHEDLMVFDRQRATCCGGSAAVDFGLILLGRMQGDGLANDAAKYLCHAHIRSPGMRQADPQAEPIGARAPEVLRRVIAIMERHLESPLTLPELCRKAQVSQRHLDRLFRAHVQASPAQYYRDIRLDRARGLVTQTEMSMAEVAQAAGFARQDHFARAYKARFGLPPSRDRVEGRVPFEFRAWPMYRGAGRG
ncbi:GlxA family transcriptional regulator [Roseovarius faecimaris]|uniref:GlxA family transcriptional regulator n=1 Tax=Roseovarius faecimaris TaxID=2494550 RepID=A0A6I6IKP4_9RHOB|nr:GlxA family transcriptional regulator [Roseovarius faecimaris]QGX97580.1 GlxA family transcriptional regulator [Roseovarius faecimaris]